MKQSISYYLTLFGLKLSGMKKNFSHDPIDYMKIRKDDVLVPKGSFYTNNRTFTILKSTITELSQNDNSDQLLIFVHGGAFVSGPSQIHWDSLKTIAKNTNHKVWMCDYPKAPEHKITEISANIDAVYAKALETYSHDKITLIGDSAGGTLVTCLVQRLVAKNEAVPKKIIIISPVMDATMSNPDIAEVDKRDPLLSTKGVAHAKFICAEEDGLKSAIISPLFGAFEGFPSTYMFIAENDITYPDQLLTIPKMKEANVPLEVIEGKNMPHIWPYLPFMTEAKKALNQIVSILNS